MKFKKRYGIQLKYAFKWSIIWLGFKVLKKFHIFSKWGPLHFLITIRIDWYIKLYKNCQIFSYMGTQKKMSLSIEFESHFKWVLSLSLSRITHFWWVLGLSFELKLKTQIHYFLSIHVWIFSFFYFFIYFQYNNFTSVNKEESDFRFL